MSPKATFLAFALVLALGMGGMDGVASAAEPQPWEQYQILIERNMFSRARGQKSQAEQAAVVQAAPDPERYVLLRGVIRQRGNFVAVLEDMRSAAVVQARAGDEVVRGRVAEVTLDGIRYARDDAQVEVSIGENLEASGAAAPAPAESVASGEQQATPAPAEGGAANVLEQMRQRRQRELGQ